MVRSALFVVVTSLVFAACNKATHCEQANLQDPFAHSKFQVQSLSQQKFTAVIDQACFQGQGLKSVTVTWPSGLSQNEVQRRVNADPCVVGLGDSVVMRPFSLPSDPRASEQKHLTAIKLDQAYSKFFDSNRGIKKDVVIAIVDSGVDLDHEDLKANIWVNSDEIAGNSVDDDRNGFVDDMNGYNFASSKGDPRPEGTNSEHGTHVAGLAAAVSENGVGITGVMGRHLKIMALNVFGKSWGADTANIDNAIRYAADNGAHVINLSLGGSGRTSSTESAIVYAVRKGVVVIAAAGNDNQQLSDTNFQTPISYAAAISGFVGVGSIDANNFKRSDFSNYSSKYVELGAPGSEDSVHDAGILSTFPGHRYVREEGTSMAAPVAGGAAALAVGLILSRGGKPSAGEVEDFLTDGESLSPLTQFIKDGEVLNLSRLYDLIDKKYPSNVKPTPTPIPTATPNATPTNGNGGGILEPTVPTTNQCT